MAPVLRLTALCLFAFSAVARAGDPFSGYTIYSQHCVQCHGEDGSGDKIQIPDFSRGEGLFQADHVLADTLKQGLGTMPAYQGLLSDNELADVITYLRTLQ